MRIRKVMLLASENMENIKHIEITHKTPQSLS